MAKATVKEAKAVFRSFSPPNGVVAHLVEYEHWWTVRLYKDNIESLSDKGKLSLMLWIEELMQAMNLSGETYLEKFTNVPK